MKINTKIITLLVIGFCVVSTFLTVFSVVSLQRSQQENIQLFKEEFLELGRESFVNSSSLFYDDINEQAQAASATQQNVIDAVGEIDTGNNDAIVYSIPQKKYLVEPDDSEITSLLSPHEIEKDLQEHVLNQTTSFDLDNFQTFLNDTNGNISPVKIQLRFYDSLGLIVGYTKAFSTVKVRIGFLQQKNTALFQSYVTYSMIVVVVTLVGSILAMIVLMQAMVIKPLKKVSYGLEQVKKGELNVKIDTHSKDEFGDIAEVFNTMTEDLEKSRKTLSEYNKTLEEQVKLRTNELEVKIEETERMNKLMVDRELRMVELKKQIELLRQQLEALQKISPKY